MRIKNIFYITIAVTASFLLPFFVPVRAEETTGDTQTEEEIQEEIDDIQDKIEKYEKKIQDLRGKANTLQNEIDYMDSQIGLTQLKIQNSISNIRKTEERIEELSEGIENLGIRIDKLGKSIDYQGTILNSRMRERYKDRGNSMLMLLFGSETLGSLVKKTEYLKALEDNDNKLIDQMSETKDNFEQQKNIFNSKKNEQEELKQKLVVEKADLDSYQRNLDSQKEAKEKLLADTQNDEAKYQELLAEAEKELASFAGFVQNAGGGVIGSNEFGSGKEGWYLSQRDSRWANQKIGLSDETVFRVGCLITCVAMYNRYYDYDVSPADIARDSSRFFSNTAMMSRPWKAPYQKRTYEISIPNIDTELKNRPVIVGILAGPFGTHFVVLSKKSGSDYIMYDPWYGPDLKFSDYYQKSSIYFAAVFK